MEFKNHCLILLFSLSLLALVTGCGHSSGNESTQLPNQRVPVTTTAPEAVANPSTIVPADNTVIDPNDRVLLATASHMAALSNADYLSLQMKWVGSAEAACNFFVITALCESGYCQKDKPFYKAADFGAYFKETGWVEVTLIEAKNYLKAKSEIDLVAQRGGLNGSTMGHIAIPYEVNPKNLLEVAQGNYHESTHETEQWGDSFATPFHYFVNFAPTSSPAIATPSPSVEVADAN